MFSMLMYVFVCSIIFIFIFIFVNSWVQTQLQNHPDELWEDGVQDYLTHASNIMVNINNSQPTFKGHFISSITLTQLEQHFYLLYNIIT